MVDAIVGLQWGSEGKGKIAALLASYYDAAVRTGAPNAGHTLYHDGKPFVMRSIPCAWVNGSAALVVGAGGMVNPDVLEEELKQFGENQRLQIERRLIIDGQAMVIQEEDIKDEEQGLNALIGSTAEGVGAAQARKVRRRGVSLAKDEPRLAKYIGNTSAFLHGLIQSGNPIMLEGTQGTGLSINHGTYPFTTSRDIIAASLFSDAGLSPKDCRYVFGVMRTYPIRVAGNSGPMGNGAELDWPTIETRAGFDPGSLNEKTTVTKRVRRVAEIDWDYMRQAQNLNKCDGVFLMFGDYLDSQLFGASGQLHEIDSDLAEPVNAFVTLASTKLNVPILGVSTGPKPEHMLYTSEWSLFENKLKQRNLAIAS